MFATGCHLMPSSCSYIIQPIHDWIVLRILGYLYFFVIEHVIVLSLLICTEPVFDIWRHIAISYWVFHLSYWLLELLFFYSVKAHDQALVPLLKQHWALSRMNPYALNTFDIFYDNFRCSWTLALLYRTPCLYNTLIGIHLGICISLQTPLHAH